MATAETYRSRPRHLWLAALLGWVLVPAVGLAQLSSPKEARWAFRTGVVVTGSSDESDPAGFTVYSAFALDAAVSRSLGRGLGAEFSFRTESREVDRASAAGPAERLGSLELLPLTLSLQYRPVSRGTFHPYVGVGANLTVAWEKSGVLDSMDVRPHVGPALHLGLEVPLGGRAVFDVGVRWNTLTTDLESAGARYARLKINPVALGAGVAFRF